MANVDNPHGLRPIMRTLAGGFPAIEEFKKVVGLDTAIFINDAVARIADGSISSKNSTDITPGTTLYSGVSLNYGKASTATLHQVIINPDAIYEAQDNADTDGFAEADMGLNCQLILGAGSTTTLISGHELDESEINAGAGYDVKLLKLYDVADNAYGSHCRVEVMFNKHRMAQDQIGV